VQTQHRGNFEFTREKYFKVLEMKTAELFALSCELSAFLSGAEPERRAQFRQFGLIFGTAYQVYDDCIDLFGSEAAAGKSLGTDLAKGKLTLPVLIAWERASAADRAKLKQLVRDFEPRSMKPIANLLAKYETLGASLDIMRQYLDKARQVLRSFPSSDGRSGLLGLADHLARQTDALAAEPVGNL
jgi:octaprenyl-diphosphate synthase